MSSSIPGRHARGAYTLQYQDVRFAAHAHAQLAAGPGGRFHVFTVQQSGNARLAIGQAGENQRPVGNRFIARRSQLSP
jgi:hypothetical protein